MKMAHGTQQETTSKTLPKLSAEFLFPTQASSFMVLTKPKAKPETSDGFAESLLTIGLTWMPAKAAIFTPILRESYILNGIGLETFVRTDKLWRGGFIDTLLIATPVSDSATRLTILDSLRKFPNKLASL